MTAVAKPSRAKSRGFTLIELLAVVVIVGILATLGAVSYRGYVNSARVSEAMHMVGAIRMAEESYRAETLTYLDVSDSFAAAQLHPQHGRAFGTEKYAWETTTSDSDAERWRQLGMHSDSPVMFGYAVKAVAVGITLAPPEGLTGTYTCPTTDARYFVLARGDLNTDGVYCSVVGVSCRAQIFVENEGQ